MTEAPVALRFLGCDDPVLLTIKVLFKLPLRQTTGMVVSLLRARLAPSPRASSAATSAL